MASGLTIRRRPDPAWLAFVVASALLAAWACNVFAQYLLLLADGLTDWSAEGAQAPGLLEWARATLPGQSPLGMSLERWPLLATAAGGLGIVVNAATSRSESLAGRVDPTTIHGTSRFATTEEMARYAHTSERSRDARGRRVRWEKPEKCEQLLDDNYVLSRNAMLSISGNPNADLARNKHVFVMAGSGAGKTWNFVQSNVMNVGSSMVFTDPKGEILERNGNFLRAHGYKVKVVNVKDEESFASSNHYNPLHYCKNSTAVAEIVDLIITNTSSDQAKGGDEFFTKAETQLYGALLAYLFFMYKDAAPQYCTIPQMIDLLALTKQDPNAAKSQLDLIFFGTESEGYMGFKERLVRKYGSEQAAQQQPEWYAITQYEGFCSTKGSPETIASIIASCYVRMGPFAISSVRQMFSSDDLELERIGTERTALFIVTSAQKGTYDFIAAMLLYQLFDILTEVAGELPGKHLPEPVCCYLDEVANIGKIPKLAGQVAFLRSYWVNLIVIVQSETDLERAYSKEETKSIRNNCDTTIYLGRGDHETCEKLSKEIGDTTRSYDSWSTSESASGRSVSKSVQYVKVPLMTADQIANEMPANSCLIHIKEEHWFLDRKANPMEHRRWDEFSRCRPFDARLWAREAAEAEAAASRIEHGRDGEVSFTDERVSPTTAAFVGDA